MKDLLFSLLYVGRKIKFMAQGLVNTVTSSYQKSLGLLVHLFICVIFLLFSILWRRMSSHIARYKYPGSAGCSKELEGNSAEVPEVLPGRVFQTYVWMGNPRLLRNYHVSTCTPGTSLGKSQKSSPRQGRMVLLKARSQKFGTYVAHLFGMLALD